MTAATAETLTSRVWRALADVVDPEFHEPITDLGFVAGVHVRLHNDRGHSVSVRLRLPVYFCAPNFAYLMVADAHDAVLRLPSVDTVDIVLEGRCAGEEVTAASFGGPVPEQVGGELAELPPGFRREAHLACMERAVRKLVDEGWQVDAHQTRERESLLRFAKGVRVSIEDSAKPRYYRTGDEVREEVPS
ncbi:iron-sulfur cluster assembly protein [Amycolatopsis carbonis]|uniref:Iron-sulfur cluster assembly protein n=1 Tax=Amycolatopsis carbonis TaxID=715471 RepID=A0A9Y2MUE6_9PSEU|nr:iron-sulfur cluster assembly protein [Amycolatopsis sp. 2-15]WIX75819.1 iron-sulfur cluster assembly protein [Amycolatopsis sp. 2-15]